MEKATIRGLIREASEYLRGAGKEPARLEAELLLARVLGRSREWLMIHAERAPDGGERERFRALVERRAAGHPLPHLTHRKEFWSLDFYVDERVLIPRPETEMLVEEAVRRLAKEARLIADIGTGCGNLAVCLAREFPGAEVYAVDISGEALEVARRNVNTHGVGDRVRLLPGGGFTCLEGNDLEGRLDLVVSNPPYLAGAELQGLAVEVRDHEPREALVAGETGEEFYPALVAGGIRFLRPGGLLLMELGLGRAPAVSSLLEEADGYGGIEILPDGAGIDRVAVAVKKGSS